MPRFAWFDSDGVDAGEVSCRSGFEDELLLSTSSDEELACPEERDSDERAVLVRERDQLLEGRARTARQRMRLQAHYASVGKLLAQAHQQRSHIIASVQAVEAELKKARVDSGRSTTAPAKTMEATFSRWSEAGVASSTRRACQPEDGCRSGCAEEQRSRCSSLSLPLGSLQEAHRPAVTSASATWVRMRKASLTADSPGTSRSSPSTASVSTCSGSTAASVAGSLLSHRSGAGGSLVARPSSPLEACCEAEGAKVGSATEVRRRLRQRLSFTSTGGAAPEPIGIGTAASSCARQGASPRATASRPEPSSGSRASAGPAAALCEARTPRAPAERSARRSATASAERASPRSGGSPSPPWGWGGRSKEGSARTSPPRAMRRLSSDGPEGGARSGAAIGYGTSAPMRSTLSAPAQSSALKEALRQKQLDRERLARQGLGTTSPAPRQAGRCGLRVIARCRPPSPRPQGASSPVGGCTAGARVMNSTTVEVCSTIAAAAGVSGQAFSMDRAFGEQASTLEVFGSIRELVRTASDGANVAVVAYGPSGSGKTHTMYGSIADQGLVPRAAAELLGSAPPEQQVRLSMLELHNESLQDLLAPRGQPASPLEVRGGAGGAMATIEGAREVPGTSLVTLLAALRSGLSKRQVAATKSNLTSSRSHVIVVFKVGAGQLTMVDLAGLERVKRSGVEGLHLREAQSINRSLTSLGDVVDALRRGASHVPVRNSRLARVMSGALGGGAETAMVVCLPAGGEKCDEAMSTLMFAERVRRIPSASGLR